MTDHDEPAAPIGGGGLVRIRLDIAYDGTAFSGWATQPGQRTVQGVLEAALLRLLRHGPSALTVAGRTDAGVHATGQTAHADVDAAAWATMAGTAVRRLAGVLPSDVRVTRIAAVSGDFDARFSALWRRYAYRVDDAESGPDPLRRREVLAWRRALSVAAMAAATPALVGEHDFAAFCRRREGATTIRTLQELSVTREPGGEIVVRVQADAFCHAMVRSLVGALLAVGDGRRDPGWAGALLARDQRADDVAVAPAHGLTLTAVGYPAPEAFAAQAEVTRRRREPADRL